MLILLFFVFHTVKQSLKGREPRIDLVIGAITLAIVEILAAPRAKPLAIVFAKEAGGELHLKLLHELLVHIEKAVLYHLIIVELLFGQIPRHRC